MNDREALESVISYHQNIDENRLVAIVDLEYNILYEDGKSALLTQTDGGSFLGRKLIPDLAKSPWRIEIVKQALTNCFNSKKTSHWLSLRFSRIPEYWLIIQTYQPLINQETKNVIGYKVSGEKPNFPLAFYRLDKLIALSSHHREVEITSENNAQQQFEQEVLFLLFHCSNYEQIAELLSLTNRKIYTKGIIAKTISRKLYPQFNVINLEALKEKAHAQGYHKKLPFSLFGEFMFPLNEL